MRSLKVILHHVLKSPDESIPKVFASSLLYLPALPTCAYFAVTHLEKVLITLQITLAFFVAKDD